MRMNARLSMDVLLPVCAFVELKRLRRCSKTQGPIVIADRAVWPPAIDHVCHAQSRGNDATPAGSQARGAPRPKGIPWLENEN
jgi:hypothetical protein